MPEYIGDPDDEQSSAEEDGFDRRDSDEYYLEMIAVANHLGILKNDIKSPINNLTGLEQVIDYAFQYAPPFMTLNDLKARVFDKMDWAQQVCEGKCIEDFIGFKGKYGEEQKDKEKRFFKGIIFGISISMLSRRITDDVRSSNGLSPLEQVIMFYFGYMREDRLKKIKGEIYSLYKSWAGGRTILNEEFL